MFGMHPNADISFAQAETYACLNTLLALQPRQVGTAAASVEEVTNRLARDMLSTIPRTFDLAAMQQKYFIFFPRIHGYGLSVSPSMRQTTTIRDLRHLLRPFIFYARDRYSALRA